MQLHGNLIRFGVHAGQQYERFDEYVELWRRSEELGYDWVSVFDHFRPPDGGPRGPCFEGPTLLASLGSRTPRVRCGILVVGVAYRDAAILAAIATTLDHISAGRLELGLGVGGPDLAHGQYGLPFPPMDVRLELLDETCRVLRSLWTGDSTTYRGKHYVLRDAHLEPKPLQKPLPIVIGGAGERRMLRLVAEHADVWNTFTSDVEAYRRKAEILDGHCADIGREPHDIRRSLLVGAVLAETDQEARDRAIQIMPSSPQRGTQFVGTPDGFTEYLRVYFDLGVRDFLLGVRRPIDWPTVELVAGAVAPALRATV